MLALTHFSDPGIIPPHATPDPLLAQIEAAAQPSPTSAAVVVAHVGGREYRRVTLEPVWTRVGAGAGQCRTQLSRAVCCCEMSRGRAGNERGGRPRCWRTQRHAVQVASAGTATARRATSGARRTRTTARRAATASPISTTTATPSRHALAASTTAGSRCSCSARSARPRCSCQAPRLG